MSSLLFEKTEEGRKAIQTRHVRLSPCQRAVLITVNGNQSLPTLTTTATNMGGGEADVQRLLELGLIVGTAADEAQLPETGAPNAAKFAESAWDFAEPEAELDPRGAAGAAASATTSAGSPPISMESLWPDSAEAVAPEPVGFDSKAYAEAPVATSQADFATAKYFALSLLEPMGLRAVQLRRTVEAAKNPSQLRDVEHLIRELLTTEQNAQLDSAFFGL
jgi:hypothetical protein